MSFHRSAIIARLLTAAAALLAPGAALLAQTPAPTTQREVLLVKQDQSDCTNSTVSSANSPDALGILAVSRGADGNTTVKVAMTVSPNTTYHFFLKCVRQLGDITTSDEGVGEAVFTFPTNATGASFAFDMYPEGAPAGNKFQSVTVQF
jgi:hypothetical protein